MWRGVIFGAFILAGSVAASSDAIATEAELLMGTFTVVGFLMILLMQDRKAVRFPVLIRTVFACSNAMAGEGVINDISVDGCKVRSITAVESGAVFRLQVYPPDDAPQIEIQKAVVHWATDGQFGVRFSEIGQEHEARLRHLVNHLS